MAQAGQSDAERPRASAADVPPHLRGAISPEEWERICADPSRAEDVCLLIVDPRERAAA
jgi:hypothetical protein